MVSRNGRWRTRGTAAFNIRVRHNILSVFHCGSGDDRDRARKEQTELKVRKIIEHTLR